MSDLPSETESSKTEYFTTRTVANTSNITSNSEGPSSPYEEKTPREAPTAVVSHYVKDFVDSFKLTNKGGNAEPQANVLHKALKKRQLSWIAMGGAIGSGLLVSSGESLNTAGPAGLLIAVFMTAIMLYCTMQALGEVSTQFPDVPGSFNTYCTRFVDPALGFAVAWNYALQWIVLLPLELVAASITIKWWNGSSKINADVFVLIFFVLIIFINLYGVRGYGEAEMVFSIIKVVSIIGFIILGVLLICGAAGPGSFFIGAKYWHDPGPFANGFKGVCNVFEIVAFSFAGTESVALCSSETENAPKVISRAIKQVFWRITIFYVATLTIISFLVPYNDSRLLGSSSTDASASPFVIAINNGGIKVLPTIMNVVILISVLSVGNTSVYATSRTLAGLSDCGQAPKFLGYDDRKGRPIISVLISLIIGLLAFLAASDKQELIFDWLLSISSLSAIFTWGLICFTHIRFRAGMKAQNRSLDELRFISPIGVFGSWIGFILNILVMAATCWLALFPIGSSPNVADFFESYLGFVIFWVCFIGYKCYYRDSSLYVKASEMDLDSGRGEIDDVMFIRQEIIQEKEYIASRQWYYRWYRFWC